MLPPAPRLRRLELTLSGPTPGWALDALLAVAATARVGAGAVEARTCCAALLAVGRPPALLTMSENSDMGIQAQELEVADEEAGCDEPRACLAAKVAARRLPHLTHARLAVGALDDGAMRALLQHPALQHVTLCGDLALEEDHHHHERRSPGHDQEGADSGMDGDRHLPPEVHNHQGPERPWRRRRLRTLTLLGCSLWQPLSRLPLGSMDRLVVQGTCKLDLDAPAACLAGLQVGPATQCRSPTSLR